MSDSTRMNPVTTTARRKPWMRMGLVTLALAVSGVLEVSAAHAADAAEAAKNDDGALGEILVTARKRAENLRDIPASITAISSATLEEAHVTQLDDLNSLVTNLNIVEAHDNTPDVTLRGVGAFGVVQGVGFYANDVQLFEGQTARPVDIERIEVLKGPQGTLFGGANVGGAIKYVTKEPGKTWENQVTAEFGSYQTKDYEAVISGPLSDTVGIRASLYYDSHGGYIYDTYNKFDYGSSNDHGGRLTLVLKPNDDNKVVVHFAADDFDTSAQNILYTPPDDHTYEHTVNDFFVPDFLRKIISGDVNFEHQVNPNVALTSLTAYSTSYNRGLTDFNKKPIPLDYLQQNVDNRVFSEELRLASTGSQDLEWLGGAFFQSHKSILFSQDNNYNGDPNNPILVGTDYDRDEKQQNQYALFGDLTYHRGDWQYELGLRYEYYTSTLSAVNTNNLDANGNVLPIAPGRLVGHEFSPRVSVQYKFSPTVNAYATIARGFTPADEIEENFVVHPYRPELATNYEVGVKALLDHHVQVNGAVFYTNYADRLYLFQALAGKIITDLTTNIGASTNYGAEFDISAPLPGGFKISGGVGALHATWGDVTNYVDPVTGNVIPNLKGLTVPFAPAYTGNVTIDWKHDFRGYEVGTRATGTFVGRSYWDPQDAAKQEAYQLLNMSAYVDHANWRISASLTNATQTNYNTVFWPAADVGAPFNIARINRPRWFLMSATARF